MTKEKVIVLRTTPYGESDLVVQALSPTGAKLSLFARGALKSKKRFAGGILEPTHYIEAVIHKGQTTARIPTLQEAHLIEGFSEIRRSYERLELAFYFLRLISQVSQEGVEDSPEIFDLLGNGLRALQTSENLELLKLHFELKTLAMQGILPQLEGIQNLLQVSLRHHEQVKLETPSLRRLQSQATTHLQEYLGLQLNAGS